MIDKRNFLKSMATLVTMMASPRGTLADSNGMTSDTGFWLPEESEPHMRTFMQWPVSRIVHPDPVFLDMLQQAIADIANTVVEFEPVVMLVDAKFSTSTRGKLSSKVELWDIPTDDLWCRDSGPLFVRNETGALAVCQLNFNGWGNKQIHKNDGKIAKRVAKRLSLPIIDSGVVGEAGGIECDGDGTLIAHESSWVINNRNALSKKVIEHRLLRALGADKFIWALGVKDQDITDYHIDSLARFVEPGVVLIQMPDKPRPDDPWTKAAIETHDILLTATDSKGRRLKLVVIPEPTHLRNRSDDFVASYVNYYVCNGAVIAAEFGDKKADEEALEKLRRLYPNREVVTLNVDPIGETGGGIHCATQQQPKETLV